MQMYFNVLPFSIKGAVGNTLHSWVNALGGGGVGKGGKSGFKVDDRIGKKFKPPKNLRFPTKPKTNPWTKH